MSSTPSPIGNNDDTPEPSQKDVKPTRPKPRSQGFTAQEILMLAQAYMRESLDPINGTSKKADVMWKDICQSYNKLRQEYDRGKIERLSADKPYTPLPERPTPSLKNHWTKYIQPAVNKFVGIQHRHPIESGETEEKHFQRLFIIYEDDVKDRNLNIPKSFEKYFQAYLWLRAQPKFGSHFEDPEKRKEDSRYTNEEDSDALEEGDPDAFVMGAFGMSSPPPLPGAGASGKKPRPRPAAGRDKSKKKRALNELAEKAAGNVKDYMAQSNKELSQQSAKKWATIENAIVEMTKTSQQMLQMQLMEQAPDDERDRFFSLMRQKAMIDAENDLAMAQSKNKRDNNKDNRSSNGGSGDSDDDSIDEIVV